MVFKLLALVMQGRPERWISQVAFILNCKPSLLKQEAGFLWSLRTFSGPRRPAGQGREATMILPCSSPVMFLQMLGMC